MAQNGLLDFLQGASNSAASTVSAPVDGLAWLLRKAGAKVGDNPIGGSDWMRANGLTQEPQNKLMGLLGEAAGGVAPMVAGAYAPQIAKGLLGMADNAMAPRTLNKQAGKVFAYPQDAALATAQRNAALPVEQGGLGLHPQNTPMERAQAMGMEDAYHGTSTDIQQIDKKMFGSSTGSKSAKQAWWAVDDPTTARGYAEYSANQAPVKALMDQADAYERIAQRSSGAYAQKYYDKYDDVLRQAEDLETQIAQSPLRGQNIMPLKIRPNNPKVMDAAGAEFVDAEGGINNFLRDAKLGGNDALVIKQLADDVGLNARPAKHFGIFNPSIIRSRFAAFDPMRRDSPDLLAGALPLGVMADEDSRNKLRGLLGK